MSTIELLKKVIMFSRLSDAALQDVAAALHRRQINQGEVLFDQGDPGDELIIVQEGAIAIFSPLPGMAPNEGQAIRIFKSGELLGEMALIDRKPRSLSARAEEASVILTLNSQAFNELLVRNPEMGISVMSGLSDKIRYTTDFLTEVRGWVRKISEGNYVEGAPPAANYGDQTLATLAAEFAQMAATVKEREDTLKREVAQLRIEIDETKRKQEVKNITSSEYYRDLKEKMKAIRAQNAQNKE